MNVLRTLALDRAWLSYEHEQMTTVARGVQEGHRPIGGFGGVRKGVLIGGSRRCTATPSSHRGGAQRSRGRFERPLSAWRRKRRGHRDLSRGRLSCGQSAHISAPAGLIDFTEARRPGRRPALVGWTIERGCRARWASMQGSVLPAALDEASETHTASWSRAVARLHVFLVPGWL